MSDELQTIAESEQKESFVGDTNVGQIKKEKEYPPVFILLRTGGRPNFFDICYHSIKSQDYPNIVLITHQDNMADTYARGDIIVTSPHVLKSTKGFYNLYCNTLLQSIPEGVDGWYHFIDDDDKYYAPDVISRLVAASKKNMVNVGRSKRCGNMWPAKWGEQKSFQTECFFLHTSHKNKATWWAETGGDHYYSKQLTAKMPVNWIDDLIICEAISGKGHGKRLDFHEQEIFARQNSIVRFCGARKDNLDMVLVKYLHEVKGNPNCAGLKNSQRWIHKDYADVLLEQGKIEVLGKGGQNGTNSNQTA